MSLEKLIKYFEDQNTPKKISDYILGNTQQLNYSDFFYYWEDIAKKTIKETNIDSEYSKRALITLYKEDDWYFFQVIEETIGNSKNKLKKLYSFMKEEMKLKLKDITEVVYKRSYYISSDTIKTLNTIIYEDDKDDLKKILSYLDDSYKFPSLVGFLLETDYDYYEIDVKNHLNKHLLLRISLYDSLKHIKDEDYKDAFVLKILDLWLDQKGADKNNKNSIMKFIEENEKDKNYEKAIKKLDKKKKKYDYHRFPEIFFPKNIDNMTEFEKRVFDLSLEIDLYKTMDLLFNYSYEFKLADKYIKNFGLTHLQILDYFSMDNNLDKKQLEDFIKDDSEKTIEALKAIPNTGQESVIKILFKINKDTTYKFIFDILPTAKSGGLKTEIVTTLLKFKDKKEEIKKYMIKEFGNKKLNVREIALDFIIKSYEDKDVTLLKEFLNKEKSDKIRQTIIDFFETKNISFTDNSASKKAGDKSNEIELHSKEWFIFSAKNAKKKALHWLDLNLLPKLHYKDDGKEIGEKELYHFINIASSAKTVIPVEQFKKFGALIKDEDLALMADKMYQVWDREAKTKWALAFVAAFGNDSLVKPLKDEILKFVDYGRGAVAAQMVEAIAMIGTTKAFQTVDWFSKKVRHKQVKSASNEALTTAARELNITKEELLDKIIPNFGFNEEGTINLDFGPRQFEIKLTPSLAFLITDNTGKSFKDLPKPNKSDDEEKSKEATAFFKEMKKEVKNQVKLQQNRLENGFSSNRLWKFNDWSELFIKNPMMKQFALTLIWGVYDDKGSLVKGFRFLEDGSFTNIEEEEITLKDNERIGLIHPIELSNEEVEIWKEQLNDYEVVQSFEQLNRTIYRVTKENQDKLQLEDFMGFIIYKSSLKNKLFNKGWERGSVQDAGCYYEYYKDLEGSGISVELNFGGDCMYDDGDTPIKEIVFYKSGTVQRGSYMYDKPAGGDTFSLKQIPERLYSEIYHEIKTIADSGKGFEEGWEKKDYW